MSGASGPVSASSSKGLVPEDAACRDCACRSRWVGYLEEIERVFAQTNVTDKRRRVLAVQVEGLCAGTVADFEQPRDDREPHAGNDARATFHDCVGGVTPRPTARISRESGCIRRGASAHPPSSVVGRAARAGANGRLRNEAGGAGTFRRDAAPTLALLLLWHV